VRNDTDRKNEALKQTYHSTTLSTTNTTWTGCASKNFFNFSVFIDSVQAFRLRKVCCPWIVTYRIRQQKANNAIKFQIQQLYYTLLTGGTILGAVFSLMTSLTLSIAYCGVPPALNVKISRLALVLIFWDPCNRVCSKKAFFFLEKSVTSMKSNTINRLVQRHEPRAPAIRRSMLPRRPVNKKLYL
jgi:hydrogenase-4 membrane subunit HyfE